MLLLLGSIIFTSWLTLSFKLLEKFRISSFHAIVFNYWTCVLTGSLVNRDHPFRPSIIYEDWFMWALIMGVFFIIIFNLVALTAQRIGVAVASVANKLSLVIPFMVSIFLYNEKATSLKILGVVIALAAVILTCWPNEQNSNTKKNTWKNIFILPLILFFGSGLLDTIIKYVEQAYLTDLNKNDFIVTSFAVAGFIGLLIFAFRVVKGYEKFDYRSIIAGLAIGIPNFFSIWCLIQVLKIYSNNSSAIIPINNMGIVLFSTLCAYLFFKEKLSAKNWWGVALSLLAISFIALG